MPEELKVGDVVKLKSGSPDMTVESIGDSILGEDKVFVAWYENGEIKKGDVDRDALQIVAPSTSKPMMQATPTRAVDG